MKYHLEVRWAKLIATLFGVGKLRPAPGTWGSAVAVGLGWGLLTLGGPLLLFAGCAVVFITGLWAAGLHGHSTGRDDAPEVVIDEVVGQWLTMLPLPFLAGGMGWEGMVLAFALFRLFDITKPWPIRALDRRLKGGVGAMVDDAFAGTVAGLLLLALGLTLGLPSL
ncbi:hypothetical protein CCR80_13695 [Rhodothalassium salexigens]|uniref:phosphatidylglycerophosphatase A family protein n=1 Tax=Rhodothalassium salexigens TaxID=1086 RepID=UPI001911AA14|nr:phosphatidylglycerophosphatase A [Rhodothalassium salexigens]MBK5922089.1 hypothetical protein [Rhodothalassium salexigens]